MTERVKSFLFDNKSVSQTIAKNSVWLFGGHVISRIVRAIIVIYAARVLGVEEWGVFSYAFSFATLLTVFMDFGISATVTRESIQDETLREKYFSTALITKALLFILIAFVMSVVSVAGVFEREVAVLMPLVVIMLGLDGFRDFFAALSRIWNKMHIESTIQVVTNILIAIAGISALLISETSLSLAWGYVVGTGVGMLASFFPFREYFRKIRTAFSFDLLKNILKISLPIGLVGLMWSLMLNMDTVMIRWFGTLSDVGYYGAIQRIWSVVLMIPSILAVAFFPSLARFSGDKGVLKKLIERGLALSSLIAVPLTIGGAILSWEIVDILYGREYIPAVEAFRVMQFSYLPIFLVAMFSNTLFSLKKDKKLLGYVGLGIGGNFLFNILFIPLLGIEGAALSTVVNLSIVALYLLFQLKKEVHFKVFHQIGKIALATLVMALCVFFLRIEGVHVYIILVVGIVIYFSSLFLLKEESLSLVLSKVFRKEK